MIIHNGPQLHKNDAVIDLTAVTRCWCHRNETHLLSLDLFVSLTSRLLFIISFANANSRSQLMMYNLR